MKKAIIHRGPPALGRSTLAGSLLKRLAEKGKRVASEPVILDKGWAPGEFRYSINPLEKYQDLHTRKDDDVVVVEIGCAEPIFGAGQGVWLLGAQLGATRNPDEWVQVLRSQGREVLSFLLWSDRNFAIERQRERKRRDPDALDLAFSLMCYDLYLLADWRAFDGKVGLATRLDARLEDELVDQVWSEARLG